MHAHIESMQPLPAQRRHAARCIVALGLAALTVLGAAAADAADLFVYSTLGRGMTILRTEGSRTGSNTRRRPDVIAIKSSDLDDRFVAHVIASLHGSEPALPLASVLDPADARPADPDDVDALVRKLVQAGKLHPGDRVLVVQADTAEVWIDTPNGVVQAPERASGLGVYVDNAIDMTEASTSPYRDSGSLGFFAIGTVRVIDAGSMRTLANETFRVGTARSARHTEGQNAWGAVPDAEKLSILVSEGEQGIDRALPKLPKS